MFASPSRFRPLVSRLGVFSFAVTETYKPLLIYLYSGFYDSYMAEAKHVGDQSYTNAELLAIWEEAWARCGKAGISYTNRSIGVVRAGPDEILRQIKYLKTQIASESGGFVRNKASLKSR